MAFVGPEKFSEFYITLAMNKNALLILKLELFHQSGFYLNNYLAMNKNVYNCYVLCLIL